MNFNPFELMKNAKVLQEQVEKMQEDLVSINVTGSSGGGIVRVTVNGHFEIVALSLDPVAVDPRDIKMLEDLIVAAHTDAMEKAREAIKAKIGNSAALSGLPGMPV